VTSLLDGFDDAGCLVIGIGNVGREDDGVGWAFVDRVEEDGRWPRATVVKAYQLALEDAHLLARMRRVLFVDSTKNPDVGSHVVSTPVPRLDLTFTSHALSVPALLATTRTCFDRLPQCRMLAIRGYSWRLHVGLTPAASANLDAACAVEAGIAIPSSDPRPVPLLAAPKDTP
jgi:hydrogenase maturation protease